VRVRNTFIDASAADSPVHGDLSQPHAQSCPASSCGLLLRSFFEEWEGCEGTAKCSSAQSPRSTESVDSDVETVQTLTSGSSADMPLEEKESSFADFAGSPCGVTGCDTPTFDDLPVFSHYPTSGFFAHDWEAPADEFANSLEPMPVGANRELDMPFQTGEFGEELVWWPLCAAAAPLQMPVAPPTAARLVLSLADALQDGQAVQDMARNEQVQGWQAQGLEVKEVPGGATEPVFEIPAPPSFPAPGTSERPSVGSLGHSTGDCRPCAFFHSDRCVSGAACQFCHLCDAEERRRRKKEKLASKKAEKALKSREAEGEQARVS